ncbi:unnamed protein product [Adineta steineri]|uniref:Cilia- and flagella-associated protein 251 n=3 Tax=Adineta steineri TaxID=433720 RepID=A0A813QDK8_9BILA|nr:unnamed protein product [Adineta steineri]CAF3935907.1 unnamed protein product [Adineta steineri]CAF3966839.1 unnamed protein product [Adineta steineri]
MSFAPPPDAPPYPATPDQENQDEETSTAAYAEILSFQWCFGFNKDLPVLNLSINKTKKIFFVSAQIGVMYDFANNRQQLLIGHRNNITSCCVSHDKRWLCTADSGRDCTIIIWDTITGLPNQTYFDVLNGTGTVAFSTDAKYLATLSQQSPQIISIWDWTAENDKPLCALELKREYSNQHYLQFNPRQSTQLVSNSSTQVLFFEWSNDYGLICFDPDLSERTFDISREKLGYITQSVFLVHPTQVVTGTTTGKLVLWDCKAYRDKLEMIKKQKQLNKTKQIEYSNQSTKIMDKKELTNDTMKSPADRELTRDTLKSSGSTRSGTLSSRKSSGKTLQEDDDYNNQKQVSFNEQQQMENINENDELSGDSPMNKQPLKLCEPQKKPITVLMTTGDLVVTGDSEGTIRFFDQELKLRMWFEHFRIGPVQSISFTYTTSDYTPPPLSSSLNFKQNESTLQQPPFSILDFTLSSSQAVIAHVTHSGQQVSIVKRDSPTAIYALDTHPFEHKLCFANASGRLQLWDYEQKQVITTVHRIQDNAVTQLRYNHSANYIAVGYADGKLTICDALSLESVLQAPFHYAKAAIHLIEFSNTSDYLATAEEDFTISVYRQNLNSEEIYTFLGRYRAHYKPIRALFFGFTIDDNQPILTAVGADRILAEYDLNESEIDHLVLKPSTRIEQIAEPMSACYYPASLTQESFLVTVNNEYKYKLYNADTKMCRKTILGPTFGSPIRKIGILPKLDENSNEEYVYFMTTDKIGLQRLPLTGNPFDQMAIIAHPNRVSDIRASYDGKYLFTSGGLDNCVHMLSVNPQVLQAQAQLGGKDLIPFYKLLEGGREGEIFREMQELFYYSQLRYQDIHRFDRREISAKIPLSEIPFVMRALGYYPTEQEIEEMINEVKFSTYIDTKTYVEDIDLNDFIKLYINHRPAFGLNPADLTHAFNVLSDQLNSNNGQPEIYRENLLCLLQQYGEHINDYEMAECLANLLNLNHETTEMFDTMNADDACAFIENQLPEQVTIQKFMEDLLKMPTQYVDQVMYAVKAQQRRRSSLFDSKDKKRKSSIERPQRYRSSMTPTTQRTASPTNDI